MINKLITLQESLATYSRVFLKIGRVPDKDTAKELAKVLEPLDKVFKEMGHEIKDKDLKTANSIWLIGEYLRSSDIRPALSVFIRRVEKQAGEIEFERMRFRLADQLAELARKIDDLVEVETAKNNIKENNEPD